MSPQEKHMLRVAVIAMTGVVLGSVIAGLIPDAVKEFVRASTSAIASGIVSVGEVSTASLTGGLVAVCTALLAVCLVFEVTALLVAIRKIRRNKSTDGPDRLLAVVERIADPLLLGAIGGHVIALVAGGSDSQMFASVPWIGPAAVLGVVFAAAIKMLPKKHALDHMTRDQKEKE